MGLKLRLILILTLPAVLAVAVHGFLRIRQEERQLIEEDRRNIALAARAIQIAVENALRDRQISDVERLPVGDGPAAGGDRADPALRPSPDPDADVRERRPRGPLRLQTSCAG